MPNMSNGSKYQEIYNKKQQNPNLSLAQLCKDAGTTYQSYNNWVKKHHRGPESAGTGNALRITVQISLDELARLVMNGGKAMSIKVESVLKSLLPQERKQLAQYLGMMRLERIQSGRDHQDSLNMEAEQA